VGKASACTYGTRTSIGLPEHWQRKCHGGRKLVELVRESVSIGRERFRVHLLHQIGIRCG